MTSEYTVSLLELQHGVIYENEITKDKCKVDNGKFYTIQNGQWSESKPQTDGKYKKSGLTVVTLRDHLIAYETGNGFTKNNWHQRLLAKIVDEIELLKSSK